MDKLRRVLSGREDNEELGLTSQVAYHLMTAASTVPGLLMLTSRQGVNEESPVFYTSETCLCLDYQQRQWFAGCYCFCFVFRFKLGALWMSVVNHSCVAFRWRSGTEANRSVRALCFLFLMSTVVNMCYIEHFLYVQFFTRIRKKEELR